MTEPVRARFARELARLDATLARMAGVVGQELDVAIAGLLAPDREVRERTRPLEREVDDLDSTIERSGQELMALQAPVASDLRRVLCAMRIAVALENIGDLAESVAKRARYLARHHVPPTPEPVARLAHAAVAAYRAAVATLADGTVDSARRVFALEDECDALQKECFIALRDAIAADPAHVAEYTHLLRAVGRLESISDLANEIVEEAWFLHHGVSLRHRHALLDAAGTTDPAKG